MSPFLDANAGTPSMIRLPSLVPRPLLTCCVHADLFFFFFKLRRNVSLTCLMFFILTRYKTALKIKHLQRSSVFWAAVLSLAQLYSFLSLFMGFPDSSTGKEPAY